MISRRAMIRGVGAITLASSTSRFIRPPKAFALGRTPYGGRIRLHTPWPIGSLDPHRVDDAAAAIFGDAVFDTLYARDESGAFVPSLAESDPEPQKAGLHVRLRADVRFPSGARLDPRAAASAIARARAHDGGAWLAEIPEPRVDKTGLFFSMRDAKALSRALASPLVAIVPPHFNPDRPEGTGPLRAEPIAGGLALVRNELAAGGPAFLESIEVRPAPDLATSLRAFESGADDIGWLGSFLHEPRTGAGTFDAGAVGWAVLRTGRDAGSLDTRGTAQALADGVPHSALASLVVGPAWEQGQARYAGAPCDLIVREDAAWLVELARSLAAALSSPSHEATARTLPAAEVAQRRATRAFALMLDVVRPAGPGPFGALVGLATADDPGAASELVRHPPRGEVAPRVATRTLRLGVVAEVRLQGGRAADVVLPPSASGPGVEWGNAYRIRRAE